MVTNLYEDVNVITIRIGGSTTGSANDTRRKASIWFKAFPYTNPVTTLPVTLTSFIATLNSNSVNIKWTTASEMNVSHFVLERSIDGTNFSEAGLVFAKGTLILKLIMNFQITYLVWPLILFITD
ncbi:MAG: hypothetical protein V9F02_04830 [Chitinophagaceae bacterium]